MDAAKLRRILDPFEANVLAIAGQVGADPARITRALAGGFLEIGDRISEDTGQIGPVTIQGRVSVTQPKVERALESAKIKIERQVAMEREAEERRGLGRFLGRGQADPEDVPVAGDETEEIEPGVENGDRYEPPEEPDETRRDAEPTADGRVHLDEISRRSIEESKRSAHVHGGPTRRNRQREILDYLAEHGPTVQQEVSAAIGLANPTSTTKPMLLRGKIVALGVGPNRSPILGLPGQTLEGEPQPEPGEREQQHGGATEPEPPADSGLASPEPEEPPLQRHARMLREADEEPEAGEAAPASARTAYFQALLHRIRTAPQIEEHVLDRVERMLP